MALISAGVEIIEKDASLTVSTAGTAFGMYVAAWKKGEGNKPLLITNENMLLENLGNPDGDTYQDYLICSHFLKYSDTLYTARAIDENFNQEIEIEGVNTINYDNTEKKVTFSDVSKLEVGCKYAFEKGSKNLYTILEIDKTDKYAVFNKEITENVTKAGTKVFKRLGSQNAFCEIPRKTIDSINILNSSIRLYANYEEYETNETSVPFSSQNTKLRFTAKTPGKWGSSLKVAIANIEDFNNKAIAFNNIPITDYFQYYPSGSKQFAILVILNDVVVESFIVSYDQNEVDSFNKSIYCEQIINRKSAYINCKDNTAIDELPKSMLDTNIVSLIHGNDGKPSKADLINALNIFSNKEAIDLDYVMAHRDIVMESKEFCEARADVIGFAGMPEDIEVGLRPEKILEEELKYRNSIGNSKYFTLCNNFINVYNKQQDKYQWCSPIGYVTGLRAKCDDINGKWFAGAGLDNGQLSGVTKIAYNPNSAQRDMLYKNDINPICSFPNSGIVLWGQKTLQGKPSTFDRVNVRGLFNYLERIIAKSARNVVFSQNDAITRSLFVSMIDPVLQQVKSKRGIYDYKIVCDESNNTDIVIQNNQFVATILIKPTYVAEFITLNFIAVGTSVSFEEAIGV